MPDAKLHLETLPAQPYRRDFLRQAGALVNLAAIGGIGACAQTGAMKQEQAATLLTVRSSGYVNRADCNIYYEVTGEGPALVFAHGLGGNHISWWQQVPHFATHYTCVTFAHRGFNPSKEAPGSQGPRTNPDDLAALIDHLKLESVTLVAQSMGGWTCLEYALREPNRVRAMVMGSTSGTVDYRLIKRPELADLDAWQTRSRAIHADLQRRNIIPVAGERLAREQPALSLLYSSVYALNPTEFRERIRAENQRLRIKPPEILSHLPMPVLYISGEEDPQFPPHAAMALAAMTPKGRGVIVPRSGHSVHFERASEFNRLVDEFLSGGQAPA
jgi:pimeloyl-ACP methyl ester carboxylesterase